MSYQDNCARCGESYDSDNLMTCTVCHGDVCYRCFGQQRGQCVRCSPPLPPAEAPAQTAPGSDTPR